MKKIILFIFLFFLPFSNVYAYTNRYFKIEPPNNYKIYLENIDTYQWVNDKEGSNIVVSISLKTGEKDLVNYTSKEKTQFIEDIIKSLEDQYYKAYQTKVDVELLDSEDTKLNGYKGILIKTKVEDFLNTGNTMKQHINVIESKNFLYSLVYSSSEKTYNETDYNNIKKSFIITDERIDNNIYDKLQFILNFISFGLLIALGTVIYRRIKNDKK